MFTDSVSGYQGVSSQQQIGKAESEGADFARVMESARKGETAGGVVDSENQALESEGQLPLEAYSLPQWFGQYIPESSFLSGKINHEYFAFAESLRRDGDVSDTDRAMMRSYLDNDPQHQAMLEKQRFRQQFDQELREYHDILDNSFKAALKEHGIDSTTEYYEKVILDTNYSQKVHQSMATRLESSPRFTELMNILGVKPTT